MPFIEWRPTPSRNVEILNDTADLYRYYDCTDEAEFLYSCVRRTVEEDLPREIDYLHRHDEVIHRIMDAVEMPDRLAEKPRHVYPANQGKLSKRRREGEFNQLTDNEVALIEGIVGDALNVFNHHRLCNSLLLVRSDPRKRSFTRSKLIERAGSYLGEICF